MLELVRARLRWCYRLYVAWLLGLAGGPSSFVCCLGARATFAWRPGCRAPNYLLIMALASRPMNVVRSAVFFLVWLAPAWR